MRTMGHARPRPGQTTLEYTPPPMPDIDQRDPVETAATLTRWLAAKTGNPAIEVFDVQAPASNGFSNETILCRTRSTGDGGGGDGGQRLVVRVAPTKHLLFLDAQFSTQYRVMRTLADGQAGVPLPTLGWYEEDPQFLGVPFFTMDHVEGEVPADNLPYTMEGWVIEASSAQQGRMWWSGIEALAAVHRTDWKALGLEWLGAGSSERPGIGREMAYYRRFLDWAGGDLKVPVLESTWQWLLAHQPEETGDVVLSWGDSRIGNIIWHDFEAAAVLDWEMASLGQPEMDLGLVALLRPPVLRRPGHAAPSRLRLPRRHHRALHRTDRPSAAGPLLLRDLLGLPFRRGHAPAERPAGGQRRPAPGVRTHGDQQPAPRQLLATMPELPPPT